MLQLRRCVRDRPNTWIAGQAPQWRVLICLFNPDSIRDPMKAAPLMVPPRLPKTDQLTFGLAPPTLVPRLPGLEKIEIAAGVGLLDVLEVQHAVARA
jgi:hypothetical protein